jgi:hypothetical protein
MEVHSNGRHFEKHDLMQSSCIQTHFEKHDLMQSSCIQMVGMLKSMT